VVQVRATDEDGGLVTYELVSSTDDGPDFFYMLPSSGEIRTQKSLDGAAQSNYVVSPYDEDFELTIVLKDERFVHIYVSTETIYVCHSPHPRELDTSKTQLT